MTPDNQGSTTGRESHGFGRGEVGRADPVTGTTGAEPDHSRSGRKNQRGSGPPGRAARTAPSIASTERGTGTRSVERGRNWFFDPSILAASPFPRLVSAPQVRWRNRRTLKKLRKNRHSRTWDDAGKEAGCGDSGPGETSRISFRSRSRPPIPGRRDGAAHVRDPRPVVRRPGSRGCPAPRRGCPPRPRSMASPTKDHGPRTEFGERACRRATTRGPPSPAWVDPTRGSHADPPVPTSVYFPVMRRHPARGRRRTGGAADGRSGDVGRIPTGRGQDAVREAKTNCVPVPGQLRPRSRSRFLRRVGLQWIMPGKSASPQIGVGLGRTKPDDCIDDMKSSNGACSASESAVCPL
jgi:hypothetical protein